jgi:hypothetical protein
VRTVTLAILFASISTAATITLTMDEVVSQPVNGLTVSKGGENFTFSNPSTTLFYNSFGPGSVTFIQDPSIQGLVSVFEVAFSMPVSSVQFGMAELGSPLGQIATVDLFNGGSVPFATLPVNATLVDPFAEGQFSFSGGTVTRIRVNPAPADALAFDNLTVTTVPEPSKALLIGTGVLLIGIGRIKAKSRP